MGQRAGGSTANRKNAKSLSHLFERQQDQFSKGFRQVQQTTSSSSLIKELYLRKNCITDLREIRHLTKLPTLKVLWLHDNPCATVDNYREIVIHHLPNLVKLDNNIITPEEKQEAQKTQFDLMVETMEDEGYPTPAV